MSDLIGYSPKNLAFDKEARSKLLSGIEKISSAVKSTLGPSGNTVLIESVNHTGGLVVTKDGVTVAKSIDLIDPIENLAVRMMKQAADRTASSAGDGPQPYWSRVLTPSGFKRMCEVQTGDVICGTNGTLQSVLGVFNKGSQELCKVSFDGGKVVECSSSHLWTVTTAWGAKRTMTAALMAHEFMRMQSDGYKKHIFYVENNPSTFYNHDVPLDPYLVGVLLGDGSISGTGSIEISLGDKKYKRIIDRLRLSLPSGIEISSKYYAGKNYWRCKLSGKSADGQTMGQMLGDIGLLGVKSDTKFIPTMYKYNSISVRESIISGLIDTDGHINKRGKFEFSTVSDFLCDDFCEVISSLGIPYNKTTHNRDNDHESYSEKPIHRVVQLKGYKHGLRVVDVEFTGTFTDMMCIKVSNDDHLYITDGYIPTHNTTSAIVITEALVKEGMRIIDEDNSLNRTEVLRNMSSICDEVVLGIKSMAKPVGKKRLSSVATISSNNDTRLGKMIADLYNSVGVDGVVNVEKSPTATTYIETTNGMRISRGYVSPVFINNRSKDTCVLDNPRVLLTDVELSNVLQIESILRAFVGTGKSLLIIAPCTQAFINTMSLNFVKGNMKVCIVPPPSFGYRQHEVMDMMSFALNAKLFSEKTGDDMSLLTLNDLGIASKAIVSSDSTIIIESSDVSEEDEHIEEKKRIISELKDAYSQAKHQSDKDFIMEKIGIISGGIGVIYAGGNTEIEQKELYDRIDDAVCAVRSAIEEGIVPGGGKTLYDLAEIICNNKTISDSKEMVAAKSIMRFGMTAPLYQILENAGEEDVLLEWNSTDNIGYIDGIASEPDLLIDKIGYGYDVKKRQFGNMVEMGVIDPAKVTRSAIENAVSVATTILSTNAIVTLARTYEQ